MNYKLLETVEYYLVSSYKRKERKRRQREWEKKQRGVSPCNPGVCQRSSIVHAYVNAYPFRGYVHHSYLDYSRMEFTRGPKCSSKYFIIEIVPRWVIKLERTFLEERRRTTQCFPLRLASERARVLTRTYTYGVRVHEITAANLKY